MPETRANQTTAAGFARPFPASNSGSASTKHTPGPWRANRRSILFDDPVMGVTALAEVFSGAADSLAQADANDCLIAAAPDLLAALRALCSMALRPIRGEDQARFDAAAALADSAIAKAEGQI